MQFLGNNKSKIINFDILVDKPNTADMKHWLLMQLNNSLYVPF